MNAEDREAIIQVIENWKIAWETKDPQLAAQDYSEDADWVNAFGMARKGREQIEQTLAYVFSLPFVMAGSGQTVGQQLHFIHPDVAVAWTSVERRGQLTPSGEPLGTRHTTHLRVFARSEVGWQIVSHLISDARDREEPEH
jgi:uncharacterized protein (TIGR02246 family)